MKFMNNTKEFKMSLITDTIFVEFDLTAKILENNSIQYQLFIPSASDCPFCRFSPLAYVGSILSLKICMLHKFSLRIHRTQEFSENQVISYLIGIFYTSSLC